MKRFESQKASIVFMLVVSVFVSIVAGCGGGGGGVWNKPVASTVTVTSTDPANGETGVFTNTKIASTFSGTMDSATLTTSTFTLKQGTTIVPGAVSYTGVTAVFTPTGLLSTNTKYTATITTGAYDTAGKPLANDYVWSFTTGTVADSTLPRVTATINANGATGVPLNTKVGATFTEAMEPSTINATTFTLKQGATAVSGNVTYSGLNAVFTPTGSLLPNTIYTATITTGAKDLSGNELAGNQASLPATSNYIWSWTTAAAGLLDTIPPTVILENPVNLATGVAVNSAVNATFSEAMDPLTISTATFTLKAGITPVIGLVTYNALTRIATFSPSSNLLPGTAYTAAITIGAEDLAGNALVVPAVNGLPKPNPWTFTTAAASIPPVVPLAINLGRAASFGIASQAGLTSTGVTVVNGDVALYPTATCTDSTGNAGASRACLVKVYSSPTGMTVNGSIYWAGDAFDSGQTALGVTTDLNAAWVEGKAKVPTKPTVAGDQLSSPIAYLPGVYHNATLGLQAGGVATFDAQGDPNAIFIFQVDSSFVDSGTILQPTRIVLLNGAQARNVWFVAGLDVTIGSGTTWNGNILAGRSATVNNGSTVTGRILAGASGAGAFVLTGAASPSVTTISVPR